MMKCSVVATKKTDRPTKCISMINSQISFENPHRYRVAATEYLESSPVELLGKGGDYPGLNTGVVLFNLTRWDKKF